MNDNSLLVLDASDNIGLARHDLKKGTTLVLNGMQIVLERDTPTGHKIAIRAIAAGEKVIKYRTPIGSAKQAIMPGDYVHIHNLKSDYLPTYTLSGDNKKEA